MWFSVNIFFKGLLHEKVIAPLLWEEQVVLVQAQDDSEAKAKGERIGKASHHTYRNSKGQMIEWVLDIVASTREIETDMISDGTEVFSRFLRDSEARSLRQSISELP